MSLDVSFSVTARYRATRALWQIALVVVCLMFRLSPLAGQQNSGDAAGGTDESIGSAAEDYSGPAVLSLGNQPALTGVQADTIQPFLTVNRIYGTGLGSGLSGGDPNAVQSGVELGFGLRGTHRWKRVTMQVEYNGNYRDYNGQSAANGLNQLAIATVVAQLKRHLVLSFRQTGGILRQDIGGLLLQPAALETSTTLPTNEPFSNGLKIIDSIVTLTYQKTRRLSFRGTIEGSLLRQSTPDVGTNSSILSADMDYRLSGRSTIGLDYSFRHFGYTTFGWADVQGIALDYTWRATKSIDVAFQVGMNHSSAVALAVVPIDPELAAILGTSTGIQVSDRAINSPLVNVRVTKRWHRVDADLDYRRGISAGNGLVLTSTEDSMIAGLHYSNPNRWTVSVEAGRTAMEEIAGTGTYTGNTFGASFNRFIRPGVQAVARFDVRPVSYTGSQGLNRTYYLGEIGFIFSPSEIPIALR
jgi:hypothetical protein